MSISVLSNIVDGPNAKKATEAIALTEGAGDAYAPTEQNSKVNLDVEDSVFASRVIA